MNEVKSDTYKMLYEDFKKLVLSKTETSGVLNISIQTLDRMRRSGEIKSKRINKGIYFSLKDIANYIDEE
jgi:hypothetical protein